MGQNRVAHRVNEMGLAQPHVPIQEEGVILTARFGDHGLTQPHRKSIVLAHDKAVEREALEQVFRRHRVQHALIQFQARLRTLRGGLIRTLVPGRPERRN